MVLIYAVRTDLIAYVPASTTVPTDPEATRLLTSASKLIRRATKTAIYDTDTSGYPTNVDIRQAFRDATCAQAEWWIANPGEELGTARQYSTVSIGSMTLVRGGKGHGGASSGSEGPKLAEKAETELRDAAVLAGSVSQLYPWEGWWV